MKTDTHRSLPTPRGSLLVSLAGAFALGSFAVSGAVADDTMRDAGEGTATYGQQAGQHEGQRQAQMQTKGAKVHASAAQVRLIQERLADAGYDPGETNGEWNRSTKEAVKNFQRANNLTATGKLDTSLLTALDAEGVLEGRTELGFFERLGGIFGSDDTQEMQGESTPIYVSPEHVAHIQQALREQGFDPGTIDGQWGPGTVQAANQFREQQGLERSERLDVALLSALDADRILSGGGMLTGGTTGATDRGATGTGVTGTDRTATGTTEAERAQGATGTQRDTLPAAGAAARTGGVAATRDTRTGTDERTTGDQMASIAQDAEPTALFADPATVRTVQQRLQEEGHDPGRIDGEWGDSTQAAIRSYQQENDELSATGELTLPTLAALAVDIRDADHVRDEQGTGQTDTRGDR